MKLLLILTFVFSINASELNLPKPCKTVLRYTGVEQCAKAIFYTAHTEEVYYGASVYVADTKEIFYKFVDVFADMNPHYDQIKIGFFVDLKNSDKIFFMKELHDMEYVTVYTYTSKDNKIKKITEQIPMDYFKFTYSDDFDELDFIGYFGLTDEKHLVDSFIL